MMQACGASVRFLAVTLIVLPLLAACGDDGEGRGNPPGPTATATAAPSATATASPSGTNTPVPTATLRPAAFHARGSVSQVYVTDAVPAAQLQLRDAEGTVVMTGTTDQQGSLIFRDVAPAAGYTVVAGSGSETEASAPLVVSVVEDHPDESFYAQQQIGRGYGYLTTRDGTKLAINVVLPGPADRGPYPTVIEYSGYAAANAEEPQPSSLIAATLGYAAVGVNMRGTGCSGGAFQFFEDLQSTDGYDVVETIAAQPWVQDHAVGMVGVSYPGISQLFVARLHPPHLAAITPLAVISDTGRGTLYPGGILNNGFATDWAADRMHDARPGGQPWSQKRMDEGDQVCIDNQKLRGQTPDLLQMIEENQFYVPEVADPLAPVTFVDRIDVPVFLAGAWQDEQTGGYFPTMLDRFTGTDKLHFTLTNGGHADSLDPPILSRWIEFLDFYVAKRIPRAPGAVGLVLQIMGQEVFGVPGLALEPDRFGEAASYEEALAMYEAERPVRILFDSGNADPPGAPLPAFEYSFDAWPIPELRPAVWYFADNGGMDAAVPTGDGTDTFIYDPSRSQDTTFHGSSTEVWKALPAWDWKSPQADKAVAYATDPLTDDLVMAGSGSVDLWLQSTARDTDLQVTLSEIRPDGMETYVQSGWLRASRRAVDAAESTPLRPVHTQREADAAELPEGEFVEARVELFPFAHVFRAGSRIRVVVEAPGGSRPLWKFRALPADGEVINTIGRSAAAPSRVVLPVVPGIEVPTSLPPCPSLRGQPCRAYEELVNSTD